MNDMKSYDYQLQRSNLFTEEGVMMVTILRDRMQYLLKLSGVVRIRELIFNSFGCTWDMFACVDLMVELNEIQEVAQPNTAPLDRIFISAEGIV